MISGLKSNNLILRGLKTLSGNRLFYKQDSRLIWLFLDLVKEFYLLFYWLFFLCPVYELNVF